MITCYQQNNNEIIAFKNKQILIELPESGWKKKYSTAISIGGHLCDACVSI